MTGYVIPPYGSRNDEVHSGVDIRHSSEIDTPIRAACDGVAMMRYDADGYGNYLVVGHGDGYATEYGHFNDFAVRDSE